MAIDVSAVRARFPALKRMVQGRPAVFFDGPAGSQVPQSVVEAINDYLLNTNANHGGAFAVSRENDARFHEALVAAADFLNTPDPHEIVFGANMTTLTFAFSRAIARTWDPGDEVVVTDLDHDANVTPWETAASDRGVVVKAVRFDRTHCTLDLDDLKSKLTTKTKLVAVGAASNAVGTVHPIGAIAEMAHSVGAEIFVDAVHFAPHRLIDVRAWNCDYLACSAYKFFGPHVGILWGRRARLEALRPYKVRPASNDCPDRWMTGTPNYECIAGAKAAIDYLASLGQGAARREKLVSAFAQITAYENDLGQRLLAGLHQTPGIFVLGQPEMHDGKRVSTVSFRHARRPAREIAEYLDRRGIFVWHGNFYALRLSESLQMEPEGMVRVGLLHYNTGDEVDRLLAALRELS